MTEFSTVLAGQVLAAQAPQDVGKSGPIGLLVTLLMLGIIFLLVRSMSKHLRRIPASFDAVDRGPQVPDTPEELFRPQPGQQVLDELRRAPLAIEGPRRENRPDGSAQGG